jgi:putative ABC transport system substrate-binding protein
LDFGLGRRNMNKELIPSPNNRKSKMGMRGQGDQMTVVIGQRPAVRSQRSEKKLHRRDAECAEGFRCALFTCVVKVLSDLRLLISGLSALLLALSFPVQAQPAKGVPSLGYLSGSSAPGAREEAFRQGLRDRGYVEGKNIVIEWRFAEGKEDRLSTLAAELVGLKVDVIVTDGTRLTGAAKKATTAIPIVMASDADPIGTGHIASLAHPGGNITGLTNNIPDLSGKRLEVLKEAIPGISQVGVIWNPQTPQSVTAFKETQTAARALGLQLQSLEMRGPDDYEVTFRAATKGRVRALTVLSDALMFSNRTRILELAAKHKLPTMHTQSLWVEAGGLVSYGTYLPDLFRRAATFVDKILKGAKPTDLPVEQPTKFELVINLKTAKQIGLTIPQSVLYRADKVIK